MFKVTGVTDTDIYILIKNCIETFGDGYCTLKKFYASLKYFLLEKSTK